jgi:DNA-directed RNA polymerase subunit K/omega
MDEEDPFFDDADYGEPNGHDEDEEDVNESADEKEAYDSDDNKSISSNESEDTIFGEQHDDEAGEDIEEPEDTEEKSKKKEKKSERIVEPSKRITLPNMTKFEYSYLISQRAMMIENGSPLMLPDTEFRNAIDISREETDRGLNPIIIRRQLPNGNIEEWKSSELIPSKIF